MTENYYTNRLHSDRLRRIYDTGLPRVAQYLRAEIEFIRAALCPTDRVLELGAGYGRILKELAPSAAGLVGLDLAEGSVALGRDYLRGQKNVRMAAGDAYNLDFADEFDLVLVLQNGLSAMKGRPELLIREALKALKPGGRVFFSTYSPKFWPHRLAWFEEQAGKGLLGALDREQTRDGRIVCVDGFTASTFSADDLAELGRSSGCPHRLEEVDDSSLFLIITKE